MTRFPLAAVLTATFVACPPALAELALSSTSPGLKLVAMSSLPEAPPATQDTAFCSHLFLDLTGTPGGMDAADKGWHLTAELPFGDLTAVSFVGGAVPATSGTCDLTDGNVGFYSGSQLVALLYSTQPDTLPIGSIRPVGDGLRVVSGDVLPRTLADLVRAGDRITVTTPAATEPVCNGAGTVPQIEGLPIDKARTLLMAAGWTPVPGDPEVQNLGWARDLVAAGVPEVQDCSGTGFAFCGFDYDGPGGNLTVVTAGEGGEDGSLPSVARHEVTCR